MASEATLIYELEPPIPFTVADGTGIEKGALLKLTDPMTAILTSASDDVVAGIAAEEKIADDGKTKLGVYRRGIFKVEANGNITAGDMVKSDASNAVNTVITVAAAANTTENIVGIALEDAGDGETFLLELGPGQIKWPA